MVKVSVIRRYCRLKIALNFCSVQIESSFFPCSRSSRYHNNFCFLQINKVEYRECNFSCTKLRLSNHVDNLISTSCRCAVTARVISISNNFCYLQINASNKQLNFCFCRCYRVFCLADSERFVISVQHLSIAFYLHNFCSVQIGWNAWIICKDKIAVATSIRRSKNFCFAQILLNAQFMGCQSNSIISTTCR